MRKIREVLRLKWSLGLSHRAIGKSCGIGHTVVTEYLKRAERAGIGWPLPPEMDNSQLERMLFAPPISMPSSERPQPDWAKAHTELKGKGVSLFDYRITSNRGPFRVSNTRIFHRILRELRRRVTPRPTSST